MDHNVACRGFLEPSPRCALANTPFTTKPELLLVPPKKPGYHMDHNDKSLSVDGWVGGRAGELRITQTFTYGDSTVV
jgi:hypothetical protein